MIDLSTSAASELGILRDGVAQVRLEVDGATAQDCPLRVVRLASDQLAETAAVEDAPARRT